MLSCKKLLLASVSVFFCNFAVATADTFANGQLYVTDYGQSTLDRYNYTYDQTTNTMISITPYGIGGNTTNSYFLGSISDPIKEGVKGTANDLIVVSGSHGNAGTVLNRYSLDGALIGTIPVNLSSYNGGAVGIGNVVITADGKYMYAPLEFGGYVVKVDLSNGNVVSSFAMTQAHDVVIAANGDIYAANYNNGNPSVVVLDSNLNFKQNLVTSTDSSVSGLSGGFHPTGLSIAADGSLYVDNAIKGNNGYGSVLHFTISGSSTLTATLDTATSYIGSSTNNALEFIFGSDIGPDGNLYIAALGGGGLGSFGVTSGYVDSVYQFNTTTGAVTDVVAGFTEPSGPSSASGLVSPKYLQFSSNFITTSDAGVPVPEPGTMGLAAVALAGLGFARRRRATKSA